MSFVAPFPPGVTAVKGAFVGSVTTGSSNPSTYTGPFGTPDPNRYILAIISSNIAGAGVTGVTIGGVPAIGAFTIANATLRLAFFIALVPSGTTGTISVSFSPAPSSIGISVYSIIGTSQPTPTNSGVGAISVPAGGFVVGGNFAFQNPGGPPNVTWTGLNLDNNETLAGTFFTLSTASVAIDTDGTLNVSTSGGTQDAIGVAVFPPFT